jgi:hypothetical protein
MFVPRRNAADKTGRNRDSVCLNRHEHIEAIRTYAVLGITLLQECCLPCGCHPTILELNFLSTAQSSEKLLNFVFLNELCLGFKRVATDREEAVGLVFAHPQAGLFVHHNGVATQADVSFTVSSVNASVPMFIPKRVSNNLSFTPFSCCVVDVEDQIGAFPKERPFGVDPLSPRLKNTWLSWARGSGGHHCDVTIYVVLKTRPKIGNFLPCGCIVTQEIIKGIDTFNSRRTQEIELGELFISHIATLIFIMMTSQITLMSVTREIGSILYFSPSKYPKGYDIEYHGGKLCVSTSLSDKATPSNFDSDASPLVGLDRLLSKNEIRQTMRSHCMLNTRAVRYAQFHI